MNVDELIQKSLTGNISEEQLESLKTMLTDQPELREILTIEHAMYLYRNQKLKAELKSSIPSPQKGKNGYVKTLIIVLLALALGMIGYQGYKRGSKPTAVQFAEIQLKDKSVSPVKLMGTPASDIDIWSQAVVKYTDLDYSEALELIVTLEKPSSEQKLYEGLCHIYKENPDYTKAKSIIQSLQQSTGIVVYDQALWYGALIDIKLGRSEDARSQLMKIVEGNLWKVNESKELLKLLK